MLCRGRQEATEVWLFPAAARGIFDTGIRRGWMKRKAVKIMITLIFLAVSVYLKSVEYLPSEQADRRIFRYGGWNAGGGFFRRMGNCKEF